MSRRYGRNQKRRAREEIARLQGEAARWEEGYRRDVPMLERALAEKRDALAAVAEVLGPEFIGLPLNELMLGILDRYSMEDMPDSFRMQATGDPTMVMRMQVMEVRADDDRMQARTHIRVRLAGSSSTIAFSDTALRRVPAHVLAREMAQELAHHIVRHIKSRGGR